MNPSTNPKQYIFTRRWQRINETRKHMEELILKLMENPATEPEHLAQAHAMYSDVCHRLAEVSHIVENAIRTGSAQGGASFHVKDMHKRVTVSASTCEARWVGQPGDVCGGTIYEDAPCSKCGMR